MNKKIVLFLTLLIIVFSFFSAPALVQGKQLEFQPQVTIPGEDGFEVGKTYIVGEGEKEISFAKYLKAFFNWSIRAIIIIGVVMIMVGGFQWMTAAGNAPKVGQARARIISALIGIGLAIGSFTILNFISPSLTRLEEIKLGEGIKPAEIQTELSPCGKCGESEICVYERDISGNVKKNKCTDDFQIIDEGNTVRADVKKRVDKDKKCGSMERDEEAVRYTIMGSKCGTGDQCSVENRIYDKNTIWDEEFYKGAKCLKTDIRISCSKPEIGFSGKCWEMGNEYDKYKDQQGSDWACKSRMCTPALMGDTYSDTALCCSGVPEMKCTDGKDRTHCENISSICEWTPPPPGRGCTTKPKCNLTQEQVSAIGNDAELACCWSSVDNAFKYAAIPDPNPSKFKCNSENICGGDYVKKNDWDTCWEKATYGP